MSEPTPEPLGLSDDAYRVQVEPGQRRTRRGLTVRARLSLLYGGMFFVAGVVLVVVAYYSVRYRLYHPKATTRVPAGCNPDRRTVNATVCTAIRNQEILNQVLWTLAITLIVVTVLAALLGYLVSKRALQPLKTITATARRIARRGDRSLHSRIELDGPEDEMTALADTFDDMLDRLDRAFDGQRRFVGNASHELRTPLAVNRTLLEVALGDPDHGEETRQLFRALLATNERSELMIEGLLLLARADNEVAAVEPIALTDVVDQAVRQCGAEAAERGVFVRTQYQPVTIPGDAVLLERVALNLVQNALRHNVPGGWVDVVVYDQGRHALLVVANTGPEVPPYAVDSLFEPFRRLRKNRAEGGDAPGERPDRGIGLGLSIVRSVVVAHGGEVTAEPRAGGGLIMRVWLPV